MAELINVGDKINAFTVLGRDYSDSRRWARWQCLCACGDKFSVARSILLDQPPKDCGCGFFAKSRSKHSKKFAPKVRARLNIELTEPKFKNLQICRTESSL